jgi:hypothetical protein
MAYSYLLRGGLYQKFGQVNVLQVCGSEKGNSFWRFTGTPVTLCSRRLPMHLAAQGIRTSMIEENATR